MSKVDKAIRLRMLMWLGSAKHQNKAVTCFDENSLSAVVCSEARLKGFIKLLVGHVDRVGWALFF